MLSSNGSLIVTGLVGAVSGDGRNLVSGSEVGRTAEENNYLTNVQLENFAQRVRNRSGGQYKKVV